jgi:adenylate cyclase
MNLLKIVSAKLAEATSERAFRYRNEHRLMAAFNSHLAPEITSRLLAQGDDYGRPRLINGVVLFADVRGFTETSLGLTPTELAHQLGGYLDEMVKVLHAHQAYVDKFIGDAVMGVWGFPFETEHQMSEAFACAKEMVVRAGGKTIGGKPVRIGVGLSAGSIFCGNVGSDLKRQFTVLGSTVNLAARCESKCKDLNASIVISEDAYARLTTIEAAELVAHRSVALKGIGEVCLYTISNEGPQSTQPY